MAVGRCVVGRYGCRRHYRGRPRAPAHAIGTARPSDWETHLAQRHQGAANVVSDLLKKEARLCPELDTETAADVVWTLNDPGLYDDLVLRRRWPAERFQSWLAGALSSQLLGS